MGNVSTAGGPARISKSDKPARAWAMYSSGWSAAAIAAELRTAEPTVRNWLATSAAAAKRARVALAGDYVERELSGLDALERAIMADAAAADPAARLAAAKVLLDIKARRAKYLGLDKPVEIRTTLSLEQLVAGTPPLVES